MGKTPKYGSREKDKETMFRWNRTVNKFRRAAGLEPFPESMEKSKNTEQKEEKEA